MVFQYKIKDIKAKKIYQGISVAETARAVLQDIESDWDLEDIDAPVQVALMPICSGKNITWKELQELDWDEEECPAPSKLDETPEEFAQRIRRSTQDLIDKTIVEKFLEQSIPSNSPWIIEDEEDEDDE